MSDILIPVETKTVYHIGVKHKGQGEIQFVASYEDHLTALQWTNRMNCTRGHRTGDLYVLETVEVAINGL